MSLNREETVILEVSKILLRDLPSQPGRNATLLAGGIESKLEGVEVISEIILKKMDEYQEE